MPGSRWAWAARRREEEALALAGSWRTSRPRSRGSSAEEKGVINVIQSLMGKFSTPKDVNFEPLHTQFFRPLDFGPII